MNNESKSDRIGLGIASLILACVALIGPVVHWLAIFFGSIESNPQNALGITALGVVIALVIQWVTLPTFGLTALILGIIAAVRGGRGRLLAFVALGVTLLTILLLVAQIIFWTAR